MIKLINDLLVPDQGIVKVNGQKPGIETKKIVSYLPERSYLDPNMKVAEILRYFQDFYKDFDIQKAQDLLKEFTIPVDRRIKTLSKGTREKLQLILVMSRKAKLYILDEPMAGVDPAARDHILDTILSGYDEGSTILISTHLIADVERVLDEVIFLDHGRITRHEQADPLRMREGKSIDQIFREDFRC